MSSLSERIASLSPAKLDQLQKRLSPRNSKEGPARPSIVARMRDSNNVPLSFAQQRLWFLEQLDPGTPAYNITIGMRLAGALRVDALQQSLQEIVRRHEVLRATFVVADGHPVQVVSPSVTLELPVFDLRALPEEERMAHAQRLASEEARRPLDLQTGPLLRVTLLRLGAEEHILLLVIHHIVSDGWSIGVFIREVATLYRAFSSDRPSPLPELKLQYADYAEWQREWLQGKVEQTQLAYWKTKLGNLPVINLPTDRPYPELQTFQGATESILLPKDLTESLKQLSQQEGVTLFMTLLAAFTTVLYHYTHQEEIVVGTDIANRTQRDTETLIGFFVNQLVLRTDLTGNPSFCELLHRVREVTLDAYANQDLPFEQLVEALQPKRNLSRPPLYQVIFALENIPSEPLALPGLTLSPMEMHSGTAKFELILSMSESTQGVGGAFEYNTDLFNPDTIRRLAGHYKTLLEAVVADPTRRVFDLPILTKTERGQLLDQWNNSQKEYPSDACFHSLFEAQAKRTPDAIVASFGAESLTYRELNRRANCLAWQLIEHGVGPDVVVGLLAERSLDFLAAIIAVFKAGGAYLPLDPLYPPSRILQVLAQSGVSLVLCASEFALVASQTLSQIASQAQPLLLPLEEMLQEVIKTENPPARSDPGNLAYVIYTSGSTGRPKGAMIEHRGMLNHLFAKVTQLELTAVDTVAQTASQCFDISVWQFLAAALVGGRTHILPSEIAHDPSQLLAQVEQQKISILETVPTVLRMIIEEVKTRAYQAPDLSSLRWMIPTGETLQPELCRQWFSLYPSIPLLNAYGPTECSDDVSHCVIQQTPAADIFTMPIGRPVMNIKLYVLDSRREPVPIGVAGELYVGGVGVGRGYLNDTSRTAEVFIPNPFALETGERLYKTGDLARYLANGQIEFLGRVDFQVKVRGQRIELREIEAVLHGHPAVQDTVVMLREDTPGQQRLVAYLSRNLDYQIDDLTAHAAGNNGQPSDWEVVWNETYSQTPEENDPTFNIVGWNSSYTGLPIPEEEVREWRDCGVERILSLQPRRVLELGCGVGILMFRIAPFCTEYCGTDFSAEALTLLRQQVKQREDEFQHVTLRQQAADNFDGIAENSVQSVILNSVAQYFTSIDYLHRVLEGAITSVEPGGFIYVGDIRSLPLLEAFHSAVQLHQAPPSLATAELKRRVQRHIAQDKELVVDPEFFFALKQQFPKIGHVQIQLKRGQFCNELTQFRYDVVLRIGDAVSAKATFPSVDWQEKEMTLPLLRQLLNETQPSTLVVRRVPNARVWSEVKTVELINSSIAPETTGELQEAKLSFSAEQSIAPEDVWSLGEELPYAVTISWSGAGDDGCFDVLLRRTLPEAAVAETAFAFYPVEEISTKPLKDYANDPLERKLERQLGNELRRYLEFRLPAYMVPATYVVQESFPLTANGKIDRGALAAPDTAKREVEADYVAPRNPVEELLAGIWREVLRVEQVGIHDNFFGLGGDSILSIQIIARANQDGLQLTPRQMFQYQTIAELASVARIVTPTAPITRQAGVGELLANLDQLSDGDVDALLTGMLLDETIV